ncbi:hypothetical protein LCGC14_1106650, partial [marine sediment metagenome]
MTDSADYSKEADPTAHASSHQDGGSDEINVQDLSGQLADNQKSAFSFFPAVLNAFRSLSVLHWITRTSPADNNWRSVCWSPELSLFCAVAITGTNNRVMTSPDGINWTTRTSAADINWLSVCWSPELTLFCAVSISGSLNRVMTSPNGINWTIRTTPNNNNWTS